jgi:hypothetical protein
VVGPGDEPAEEASEADPRDLGDPLVPAERRDLPEHAVPVGLRRAGQVLREPARLPERVLARGRIERLRCLCVPHGRTVPQRPHVLPALDLQHLGHPHPAPLVEREAELPEEGVRPHACAPDQRPGGDPRAVREQHLAAVERLQRRRDVDLYPSSLEMTRGVLAEPPRDLGEDLRRRVDEHPAPRDAPERRVEPERVVCQVVQLSRCLHSGVAGADEDEPELLGRSGPDRRALELLEDAVAKRDGVGEVLEPEPVLAQPRDRESPRHRAEGDDEARIADLVRAGQDVRVHDLALLVEAGRTPEHELDMRAHLPERHDDVPRLERASAGLGEQKRVEHVVLGRQDGRTASAEEAADVAPREASAEDQRPVSRLASLHASSLPRWRSRYR